jgi:uncharacterized protein YqgC (DUF456 family)
VIPLGSPLEALASDPTLLVAVALLLAGVVGSVAPGLPSGLLSLAGVGVYWLFGARPLGLLVLFALALGSLLALVVDWGAGVIAAGAGGASPTTAAAAGLVGLALFFLTGPVGTVVGVVATVFALEYYRGEDSRASARSAGVTAVGMALSLGVQLALTMSVLVGFLIAVVV